jgi:hypothetical protein
MAAMMRPRGIDGMWPVDHPLFQFELQHVKQCLETFVALQSQNSSYFLDLYLMIQAESRGEPIDKVEF